MKSSSGKGKSPLRWGGWAEAEGAQWVVLFVIRIDIAPWMTLKVAPSRQNTALLIVS